MECLFISEFDYQIKKSRTALPEYSEKAATLQASIAKDETAALALKAKLAYKESDFLTARTKWQENKKAELEELIRGIDEELAAAQSKRLVPDEVRGLWMEARKDPEEIITQSEWNNCVPPLTARQKKIQWELDQLITLMKESSSTLIASAELAKVK
jgi:hypothetical protein